MHSNYNEMRLNGQLCDGVIKTSDGGRFLVHRVVLGAFSPYFRAYFTNSLGQEGREIGEMTIDDEPKDIVAAIVECAYTGTCAVNVHNAQALMVAADRFSCESLVKHCADFIGKQISFDNFASMLRFARNYLFRDLEVKVWQFGWDQMEELMNSSEFLTLTADELSELLSADELNVKQEEVVFEAIDRWIRNDPESRRHSLAQLLRSIRFALLSGEFYNQRIKNYPYNTEESLDLLLTIDTLFDSENDSFYFYCHHRPRIPNEVVFTIGGWSDGYPTDAIETYDKRSDSWYLSHMKDQKIRAYHGVVVLDKLIYIIGGFNGSEYFSTMHCYDPVTYKWTEKACMHDVRCYISVATLGGEIYAIGGYNGRTRLNTAEKYNPLINQWTMIAPLNKIRSDASAASLFGKIYVAGGFDGGEVMRSAEVYTPESDSWLFVDYMTVPRSGVNLISHGSYIYALGGYDGVNRLYSCERYNPVYNRWDQIADMQNPRSNLSSVIVDNSILVIGGFDGTSTVACTEFYNQEEDKWFESASMNINKSALAACVVRGLPNAKSYTFLGIGVDPAVESAGGSKCD
ncbi:kelch-like protein 10 isoform X2 [Macrosteles quadrilineatus]|uniref:kelch-like protein 10 isoform X2 n=1 Tax=Macrosteles quadrilineatus TaxID=74068 RepID=UPI0023E1B5A6|nr:kelch-like protein 10 isoform X2 [Macrosteles quadrilineatus]